DSFIPCSLACGIPLILLLALLFGVSQMPKALRYILWILVTIDVVVWAFWFVFVLAIQVDNRIGEKKEDLNLSWEHGIVKEIVLRSQQGESRHENIDVSFGNFKGQFKHRIRRHPWGLWAMAYKLDDEGRIVFAADRGQEGEKTYPILSPYGWWETDMLQVLFPCRALSVFDTVDSRYLSALDYASILGENDATPIWWGTDQVQFQSQREGKTTEVAVFYARPGTRVKILMSTSLIGVKYLLTNSPDRYLDKPIDKSEVTERVKAESRGKGYPIETGVIFCPSYVGTKDMWVVDDVRMKELAKYGVENKRIEGLHDRARAALEDAKAHWDARRYDKFMAAAREAWGLEARGYPDVKSTANDTVKGIVFYFILLLPFSFFVERLVFGFADIRKRLIAFFLVFFLVFLVLHFVHPAFKLSSSPYIIFLAFVIFALSGIVLFMVLSKFNEEVQKIKRAAAGIHEVDVGRLSATFAAVTLGISNLRKRKVRTSLTAITLILLTFTVLSFTSVTTSLKYYKLPRENKPPYQGVLVRDRNWKGLQTSVLRYLQSAFKDKATLVPRSWFMARMREERQYLAFTCPANGKISYANAFLGMTPQESIASHLDQYLIGEKSRWLQPGDLKVCILPNDMAALIDLTADDLGTEKAKIRMLGSDFEVIGILDSERFNRARCLDDEKLTPVDTVVEGQRMSAGIREDPDLQASEPLESFVHLESTNVMILPHEYLMDIGGTLRSVAITGFKTPKFTKEIENFMSRVALTVFVGEGDQVTVYSSIGSTALGGLGHLFIPILIAALIVLNTMMGSVYERFREIGIYSSVGLAPSHIASLFLAESSVFATVGAVMGYLVGQVLNLQLSNLELLKGVNLNYSSLSAISSTLVVMATVFLSTLYPAKKAAGMAVPDVTRKWKFPEPKGDQWIFDFPFTVAGAEIVGMYAYLARVFESYGEGSTGGFVAEGVKLASQRDNGLIRYIITMKTWLAPYDLGISQDVRLDAIPTGEHNVYRIEVNLQRVSGDVASWRRINRGFLNVLRKRFLVWRTIPPGEKLNYRTTGMTQFSLTAA
ncbi:MAG: ABC transporter permease, partial [Planctomycetes bacterium]|nr:ABC transporter permease [Planctomycetota bacterium]